jgi:hypothetical protein
MALAIVGVQRSGQSSSPRRKAHQMINATRHSAPLEPRNLFVETVLVPESEADSFPVLSPEAVAVLDSTRPELEVPLGVVATAARLPKADAQELVTVKAKLVAANEPVRNAQTELCEALAPALETELDTCRVMERKATRSVKGANPEKRVLSENGLRLSVRAIPFYVEMLIGVLLIIAALGGDTLNGLTILKMANELQDESVITQVAFVSPYVLAMFCTICLLWVVPGPRGRSLASYGFVIITLPLSLFGLWLFSGKMGEWIDPTDVFNPVTAFPIQWVTFFAILSGAGIAGSGKIMCSHAATTIFGIKYIPSPEYEFHKQQLSAWTKRRRKLEELQTKCRRTVKDIADSLELFVKECLGELEATQQYIAHQQARLLEELLPLPSALRGFQKPANENPCRECAINGHCDRCSNPSN